ncbi:MAG: acyl-CoA dehydrogenase family protein [Planctomycetota bacterium]|nr:acyl-CoA dehydrogenase family protein [Planctomycetota bacterium]
MEPQRKQDPLARAMVRAHRVDAGFEAELASLGEDEAARTALAWLAERDLCAWAVPAAWGGAETGGLCAADDVSVRALSDLRMQLAYSSGMLDVMLVMQGLGSYSLARGGSDELRALVLPAVAKGELVAAFGLTEPGAGSSLGEVATRAERDGDDWLLTGTKTFISNAGLADFYTVLVRTSGSPGGRDGGDGLTMFFVPGDAAGLEVERFEVLAPHPIGTVTFDGVRVPDAQRLGELGGGLSLALGTLARFRTSVAAAACGFARRALVESRAHLLRREQFGKPLAANQALRFDLAEMETQLVAAELLTRRAAKRLDKGHEAARDVARAKLFATEAASWIADRALQHHGGLGVKRGEVVERLYRDVRALRIYEGTSEVQKLILAKALLSDGPDRGSAGQKSAPRPH